MARNISTIYDSIIDYKESRSELDGLNSTSQTAIYKFWAYVTSVAIYTLELLWDLFKIEIEDILDKRINGTNDWYAQKALDYQDGDKLTVLGTEDNVYLGYSVISEDNKIITRAAYSEDTVSGEKGRLRLKVAKGDTSSLSELDAGERGRFNEYITKIKFAGTNILVISEPADTIDISDTTVYHDGTRTDDDVKEDVLEAINNYLINLPFDGIIFFEKYRDAIQAVEGVSDVHISQIVWVKYDIPAGNPDIVLPAGRQIVLYAGYAKVTDGTEPVVKIEDGLPV